MMDNWRIESSRDRLAGEALACFAAVICVANTGFSRHLGLLAGIAEQRSGTSPAAPEQPSPIRLACQIESALNAAGRQLPKVMKLKELARQLGLSQTTVSRALNGYPEVSEAYRASACSRRRSASTIDPMSARRRLATGRAGAVGAVLQTDRNLLLDPHYVEFLAGLGERLAEDEIDIVL